MSFIPHNHVSPPDKAVHPKPAAHQDEAVTPGRAAGSSVSAFVGLGLALAGAAATYFDSPTLLMAGVLLAVAAILVSAFAWRTARRLHRPRGVAVAGLLIGIITVLVFIVLD
jgi:drug/metabolite transporter (DMT)-like permease